MRKIWLLLISCWVVGIVGCLELSTEGGAGGQGSGQFDGQTS